MNSLLLLKIGFFLLPLGASMVIASKTVRQGGNVNFHTVLRDGLALLIFGGLAILISIYGSRLGVIQEGFDLVSGAGGALILLGAIELMRYFVFRKPRGSRRLSKAGFITSAIGLTIVIVWAGIVIWGLKFN